jgi:hypothetical protein
MEKEYVQVRGKISETEERNNLRGSLPEGRKDNVRAERNRMFWDRDGVVGQKGKGPRRNKAKKKTTSAPGTE